MHHLAVTAATVGVTPDGALRLAGLGTEAAARGLELNDSDAAHTDAAAVIALFSQLVTTADGVPPDAQEILDSLPHEVRATSNLVVGLTPWAPVPPVAALVAGLGSASAQSNTQSSATAQPEPVIDPDAGPTAVRTPAAEAAWEAQALEAAGLDDAAGEDEVLAAVEEELVAQSSAGYGSPGWIPVITPEMEPPSFDDVMKPGSSAAATGAAAGAAGPDAAAAVAGAAGIAAGVTDAGEAAGGAAAAATGAASTQSPVGSATENPVKGWLRRLDAVIPSAPTVASTAATDPATPVTPARVIDPSGWSVATPAVLSAAPETLDAVLEPTPEPITPGAPVRHDSSAGVGAIAAAFSGLLSGVTSRLTKPVAGGAAAPAGHAVVDPTVATPARGLNATRPVEVAPAPVQAPPVQPVTQGSASQASYAQAPQPTPAWNAVGPAAVSAKAPAPPKAPKAPKPTKAPKAPKPQRPQPPARDEDYEAPRRKPRGNINATPFVLLIVLGGVVWVLYLALQSLLAAAGFGSTPDPSEPATGAPAVSAVSSVEASPSPTDDVLEGESSAVVISPSDLPQF